MEIFRFVGHSKVTTTLGIYAHLFESDHSDTMDALGSDGFLTGPGQQRCASPGLIDERMFPLHIPDTPARHADLPMAKTACIGAVTRHFAFSRRDTLEHNMLCPMSCRYPGVVSITPRVKQPHPGRPVWGCCCAQLDGEGARQPYPSLVGAHQARVDHPV